MIDNDKPTKELVAAKPKGCAGKTKCSKDKENFKLHGRIEERTLVLNQLMELFDTLTQWEKEALTKNDGTKFSNTATIREAKSACYGAAATELASVIGNISRAGKPLTTPVDMGYVGVNDNTSAISDNEIELPDYDVEKLKEMVKAAESIGGLLPHPDEVYNENAAKRIRNFNRAFSNLPLL